MNLLLIEDDSRLLDLIRVGLCEEGHVVESVSTAREGLNLACSCAFDALIVDVLLPEASNAGFRLVQDLRDQSVNTPVLFLTARDDLDSRLLGLNVGGDDYLTKLFDFRELRSRLSALVRRSAGRSSNALPLPRGFRLDLLSRQTLTISGTAIPLTPRELELLEGFALHPERTYSREELLSRVWYGLAEVESRVVQVRIAEEIISRFQPEPGTAT